MHYSNDLDIVVNSALDELIHDYIGGDKTFSENRNKNYLNIYMDLKHDQNNK